MSSTTTMNMVKNNGWIFSHDGWLDEPFFRNVRVYKKDGIKSPLIISIRRNTAYYLDQTRGVYGHFLPLTERKINWFEETFK